MANVFKGICIETLTPNPEQDATFVLERGKEYTISRVEAGHVRVFSRYWCRVPSRIFAGVIPLGSHTDPWEASHVE